MRPGAQVVRLSQADVEATAARIGRTRDLVARYADAVERAFGRGDSAYARQAERCMGRVVARCGLSIPAPEPLPPLLPGLDPRGRWLTPDQHAELGAALRECLASIDPPDGRVAVPNGCLVEPSRWLGGTRHLDHMANVLGRIMSVRHMDEVIHAEQALQYQGCRLDSIFAAHYPSRRRESTHMPWTAESPRPPTCVEGPRTVYLLPDSARDSRIYHCPRCATRVYDRPTPKGYTTWEADRHQIRHAKYKCDGARYRLMQLAEGHDSEYDLAAAPEDQRRAIETIAQYVH